MRASTLIAGLSLIAGCGPRAASSEATPPAPATATTCARLADHLVTLLEADLEASGLPTDVALQRRSALLHSCVEHGDAPTARCLLAAGTLRDADRCRVLEPSP